MPVNEQNDPFNGNDHKFIFSLVDKKQQKYCDDDSSSIDTNSTITINLPQKSRKTAKITIFSDDKIVAKKTTEVNQDKSEDKIQSENATLLYADRQKRTTMSTIRDM